MGDLFGHLTDAPIPNLPVLAGLAFIAIAVFGSVTARIIPSKNGRIASGVVGAMLITGGLLYHASSDSMHAAHEQAATTASTAGLSCSISSGRSRTVQAVPNCSL